MVWCVQRLSAVTCFWGSFGCGSWHKTRSIYNSISIIINSFPTIDWPLLIITQVWYHLYKFYLTEPFMFGLVVGVFLINFFVLICLPPWPWPLFLIIIYISMFLFTKMFIEVPTVILNLGRHFELTRKIFQLKKRDKQNVKKHPRWTFSPWQAPLLFWFLPRFLIWFLRLFWQLLQAWGRCCRSCARTTRRRVRPAAPAASPTSAPAAKDAVRVLAATIIIIITRSTATTGQHAKSCFRIRSKCCRSRATSACTSARCPTSSNANSDVDSAARDTDGRARCAATKWSSAAANRRRFSAQSVPTRPARGET